MVDMEKEFRLGKHRVFIDDDNIVHVTSVGEIDDKTAETIMEISREMMTVRKEKLKVIVDCNKTGKPSPKARAVFQELGRHEKLQGWQRRNHLLQRNGR